MKYIFPILLILLLNLGLTAQNDSLKTISDTKTEQDTTSNIYTHSAKKASWMSTVVPGLGQAYNKKYWKIPVIYALFGTFGYLSNSYNKEYISYRDSYKNRIVNKLQPDPNGSYSEQLTNDELKTEMKRWERNRNFNYIGLILTYVANIVDASVDAHLYYYDISDDLSLKINPTIIQTQSTYSLNTQSTFGVQLKLTIK